MKYLYSTIRFVPNPSNGECVNVGILVGSEATDEWVIRVVTNISFAAAFDDQESPILPSVMQHIEHLSKELEDYMDAERQRVAARLWKHQPRFSEAWLSQLASDHRNALQFDAPLALLADSIEEAMNMMWKDLIREPKETNMDPHQLTSIDVGRVVVVKFDDEPEVYGILASIDEVDDPGIRRAQVLLEGTCGLHTLTDLDQIIKVGTRPYLVECVG